MSESNVAGNNLVELTTKIISAYVGSNVVQSTQLPELIGNVYASLVGLGKKVEVPPPVSAEPLVPAVSIRKSVTPDYIVCLEDGRKLKMLKRHLRTTYNLTPEEYRARWNLPPDYPMVAPNYAAQRSGLAKAIGLGQRERR